MIRILHVFGSLNLGGAEMRIVNLMKSINKNEFKFYFVSHTKNNYFKDEIERLGGQIFYIQRFNFLNFVSYYNKWLKILKENNFDVIHGHMLSTSFIYMRIANKMGIKIIIAHARSEKSNNRLKLFFIRKAQIYANNFLAVSKLAGWNYFNKIEKKKIIVAPNSFHLEKYLYSSEARSTIRTKFNLHENIKVFGHIGRFENVKNHQLILKTFIELKRKTDDIVLVLIGEGKNKDKIKKIVKKYRLCNDVYFIGQTDMVYKYYSFFDYFLFFSKYEGFPGVVVEAQLSGLKCFISNKVTSEVFFNNKNIEIIDISKPPSIISEFILLNYELSDRVFESNKTLFLLNKTNLEKNINAKWYENYYRQII